LIRVNKHNANTPAAHVIVDEIEQLLKTPEPPKTPETVRTPEPTGDQLNSSHTSIEVNVGGGGESNSIEVGIF
jgi:hypothetical protein